MQPLRKLKVLSRILILALLHLCWLTSYGWAEMVPTGSVLQSQTHIPSQTDRQRLLDLLQREDIQMKLQKYGISKVEAAARINSLTDEELSKIAGKLDRVSAGGHDSYEYDEDPFDDMALELLLWITLFGLIAVSYFVGVIFKSVGCVFAEDCGGTAYVFRPWWDPGEVPPVYVRNVPIQSPPAYSPVVDVVPPEQYGACDPRAEACEWSVR